MTDSSKKVAWIAVSLIVIMVLGSLLVRSEYWNRYSKNFAIDTEVTSFSTTFGQTFGWMTYIFGGIPTWLANTVGERSAIVITLFTWLLLFVTFADIFASFSTFNIVTSWIAGFSMTVIMANLKMLVIVLGISIGLFAFAGGFAIIAGLIAAFDAFIAVNLGIGSVGPWLRERKEMMSAAKHASESEAGGEEIAGAIRGLEKVGESLKRARKSK